MLWTRRCSSGLSASERRNGSSVSSDDVALRTSHGRGRWAGARDECARQKRVSEDKRGKASGSVGKWTGQTEHGCVP